MKNFNDLSEMQKAQAFAAYQKREEQKTKERIYWARQTITLRKAKAAGINVTDAEIDAYLANKK